MSKSNSAAPKSLAVDLLAAKSNLKTNRIADIRVPKETTEAPAFVNLLNMFDKNNLRKSDPFRKGAERDKNVTNGADTPLSALLKRGLKKVQMVVQVDDEDEEAW